ncbi:hypothetical protein FRC11_011532, partial [Ceratobasidium sp. 423]
MSHIDETVSDIDYEYPDDENIDAEWDPEPELDEPPELACTPCAASHFSAARR